MPSNTSQTSLYSEHVDLRGGTMALDRSKTLKTMSICCKWPNKPSICITLAAIATVIIRYTGSRSKVSSIHSIVLLKMPHLQVAEGNLQETSPTRTASRSRISVTRIVPESGYLKSMNTRPVEIVCKKDKTKTTNGCAYLIKNGCCGVSSELIIWM